MITIHDYRKRSLRRRSIYITCQRCQQELIVQTYYETRNLCYLCVACYTRLAQGEQQR
jgi:hypothetical protein